MFLDLVREKLLFLISTPLYTFFIGGEILLSFLHNRKLYTTKGTLVNFWLSTVNLSLDLLLRGFVLVFFACFFKFHFTLIKTPWIYWLVLLFTEDFLFYWLHRVDHFCRLFWAVHVTHHSSQEFNLTIGFRSSVFQPLYRFIWFLPLPFLGFNGEDIMLMYAITQIYGILIHTQYINKLGPLEIFMSTPSHHRVHHGANVKYLDKNMGMVFIFWDKLFGTFQQEDETVKFGLVTNIDQPYHPFKTIFHEWEAIINDLKKSSTSKAKFMYLFGPPGWSHDNSKKTSKQLREELKIED